MLYKLLVYILLTTSADALEAGPISRRSLLGKATAGAFLSSPLAAFARDPIKQASDAAVYDRADEGSLTSARVNQRAETNQMVVGKGATCTELEAIIAVDKQAIRFDQDKLEALAQYAKGTPDYEEQRQTVADIEAKIEMQVKKLSEITTAKKCGANEASVYRRAEEGKLNSALVIQRAKEGRLVSGQSATCKQLDAIIAVDKDALALEKNKLKELLASKSPSAKTQIKIVAEAEFAIAKQLTKLQKRRAVYVEEFYGLDGC